MNRPSALPFAVLMLAFACTPGGPVGGPASGPSDTHCGGTKQATSAAACHPAPADEDGGTSDVDAGDSSGDTGDDYGATMYGTSGDDDDCKYHVKWTATPIRENDDVTFTVTATKTVDGTPLTGAQPYAEVFLSPTHPSPSVPDGVEKKPGVYDVGPVDFDASGRWTVRFHFYGDCADESPESPHGHAAFFVDVP